MFDQKDFEDEIRSHLAMAEQDRLADGADPKTAKLASLKEFGNVTLTSEAARGVWRPWWIERLAEALADVLYAGRALAKNPVFSITVIAVLTLGIGLNAAVFTMLKSIALTPLGGVDRAAQLRVIHGATSGGREITLSYPDYRDLREHDRAFSGLMGTVLAQVTLGRGRDARPASAELVSGNYFQVLDVPAVHGRTLLPSDEQAPSGHPVVVISDGLWRRDFGARPDIIGSTLEVNNQILTVVGVADPAFHGTIVSYDVELFIPVMMAADLGFRFGMPPSTLPAAILADRRIPMLNVMGHLKPGVTPAQAAEQIAATWTAVSREVPDRDMQIRVVPFWRDPNSAQSYVLPTVFVLSAMALLVLLIACANIAGLVLVRGVSRRGEIAVRLSLGATRARIVRLLIVENIVLAIPGAVLGVTLALQAMTPLIQAAEQLAAPQRLYFNIQVDSLVIAFAAVVACGCALVFGLVPALSSSQVHLASVIHEDASPRGAARGRMRASLVVAQVAVSLILLVGAGLVARTLEAARRADPGFDPGQTTAIELDVTQNGYDQVRGRVFYRGLLDAAREVPGVESATLASAMPMAFLDARSYPVAIDGYQPRRGEDLASMMNAIAPDYFDTLRIPLRAGRDFENQDDEHGQPIAIVNQTFADRYLGGAAAAVGRRIRITDGDWRTVVGVAADVKYARINESPRPYIYVPFLQSYRPAMVLHTRAAGRIETAVDSARNVVERLDPDLPIIAARSMSENVSGAFILYNFMARMLFGFGIAGMALAALGTYGVVSYLVKQSAHEIGIRIALGAQRLTVLREFVGRGIRLGAIGAGAGVVAALALTRLLEGMLFGVSATDVLSFTRAVAVVLGGVAVASVIPAWRAARTNPLVALRNH